MSEVDGFPLAWPQNVPRTPAGRRLGGSFMVTPGKAMQDLIKEVGLSGGSGLIVSSNVPLRRDGFPYVNAREPDDPGVAVYFTRKEKRICIPCDTYDRRWKNVRAIGLSIKDMRGPEMRGCAAITDAAYTGFLALPAPQARRWHEVLGVRPDATIEEISRARRDLARSHSHLPVTMAEINAAHDEGMAIRRTEG